ncbi:hypothetical protein HYPDE_33563 [Hyphomicrobium denitrificans 1NES1]|uniref:DUF2147 domain-containing protein n=1 Tax=Hyphomicrobium denitrificans 1NES1 TaxID=670307 RepID=N0BE34_9HYPH|nr:DUF2147 domain-containing protein [Hyphomicrobium denitrificans]AGK58385.1 hypothetical protein HYPDE_33563 [Hyphomicrobium denitrificans 1NES1]
MRRVTVIASAFAVSSLISAAIASASAASDPTGIWINDTGRGAIEIKPCGNALCGNVVWVKDTADAKGCGKQIIGNVAPVGGGRWDNGWIYSPERGRKYNVELKPLADGTLRVTGYAGLRFLSKTMIWTRAPADLQLCGQPENQIEAKASQPAGAKLDANSAAAASAAGTGSTASADANANSKPAANPQVAIVAPPPAPSPNTTPTDKPAAKAANGDTASPAPGTGASDASKPQSGPPAAASQDAKPDSPQKDEETASADDGAGSELEQKLNGLGLGKVFTKTKSGKCKLDLPWVKLTVDCEH